MSPTTQLVPEINVRIGGSDISDEVWERVLSVEVDDSLFLPDMFAIHLRDYPIRWVDSDTFAIGNPVEVSANSSGAKAGLISGEITAIEFRTHRNAGATLMLRGYDRSHRLNRDRKSRSFVQMTDSDIATKIAKEAGLKAIIDSSPQVHHHVLQDNQTDWEFLTQRSRRLGYRLFVKGGTLNFIKAAAAGDQPPTVEWGIDLLEFNVRMSTALQVSEVIVQGWDPDKQQQLVGKATTPRDVPKIGDDRLGGQIAKEAFGIAAKKIVVNRPVATQAEADALAQSICNEVGQAFIEAEGVCIGNPGIQAGATVHMKGVGTRFSGTYRVTHALHRCDQSGYTTEFTIGGRYASVLSELLTPTRPEGGNSHCPMLAVVTNNEDPDKLGRVKVKLPTLTDSHESTWARLAAPGAGKDRGLVWIPDVGDEVLVLFEHEDINHPIVIGGLWNQKSPPADASNLVASGKSIAIHIDTHEKMGLKIMDSSNDTSLNLGDQDNHLALSKTDRQANLKSADKVVVEGMNISVSAQTNLEIKSSGNIKIEGSGVVEIKGSMIKLN